MPWDQYTPLGMVEWLNTITIFLLLYPHATLAMLVRICHHIEQWQNLTWHSKFILSGYSMFSFSCDMVIIFFPKELVQNSNSQYTILPQIATRKYWIGIFIQNSRISIQEKWYYNVHVFSQQKKNAKSTQILHNIIA